MKIINLIFVLLLFPQAILAKSKLLIALYERNPWKMVVGSDSPTFTLYENGTVIFWESSPKGNKYKYIILNRERLEVEFKKLNKLKSLKSYYSLSDWTDQPTNQFHLFIGKTKKEIVIYGDLRKDEEVRNKTPKQLLIRTLLKRKRQKVQLK